MVDAQMTPLEAGLKAMLVDIVRRYQSTVAQNYGRINASDTPGSGAPKASAPLPIKHTSSKGTLDPSIKTTIDMNEFRHDAPALITTGDAIDSFLREPDETTSGLCLFSEASMYLHWEWRRGTFETSLQWKKIKQRRLDSLSSPVYEPERWFWGQSASPMRWIMCFILYVVTQPCHVTHH
ncbi:MAG: hypothetical protein L6R42_003099 [Xanthoria sp. 1 TBL-2021]|nr:MAG: hypothetical protein L6R42_003099 [Xanthoria sp. 1 TBL-2021]